MKNNYIENSIIGELLFIREVEKIRALRGGLFECQYCHKQFKTVIASVKSKNTTSCGCEALRKRIETNTKHGGNGSVEHEAWNSMKRRCKGYLPLSRIYYKDKGITVCDRWLEPDGQGFKNFLEDMGKRPGDDYSLDRIDGTKGYSPENCRWATIEQQNNNLSRNVPIEYEGRTQNMSQWAKEFGLHKNTFRCRLKRGLSMEEIKNTPLRNKSEKT